MHIIELDLSPAAIACLRAADILWVDELRTNPADDLIAAGVGPHELFEKICRLNEHDLTLPASRLAKRLRPGDDRDREMLRLRLIEGRTLEDVGERVGLSKDRVRQLVREHFGLTGDIPTVKARRWMETQRRHLREQS